MPGVEPRWSSYAVTDTVLHRRSLACLKLDSQRAGVAQSVQRLTTDRAIEVRSPAEADYFSSILCVQTGSEAHPASCTMGTGGPFPGGKAWPERDSDHSPHLMLRSRMSRSFFPLPLWACKEVAGQLYLT
jgi:hypothetical protein